MSCLSQKCTHLIDNNANDLFRSRHLLSQCREHKQTVGVVVNEMSTLDIDGQLIAEVSYAGENEDYFATISAGALSSPQGMQQLADALARMVTGVRLNVSSSKRLAAAIRCH